MAVEGTPYHGFSPGRIGWLAGLASLPGLGSKKSADSIIQALGININTVFCWEGRRFVFSCQTIAGLIFGFLVEQIANPINITFLTSSDLENGILDQVGGYYREHF